MLREALNALNFMKSKGIFHRDIKPDNILLIKGRIILTDFGISKIFDTYKN